MANTENIEAKLCAYIDGDLDAQGRAEIEKHLASNPQHRTLIEQLSKQRDLLRGLPREDAPEEILEALQGHMERSVLLGDADAAETETLKIHRWPQFAAMAAMVLLTVGLGVVIYFVLPRNGGGNGNYAVVTSSQPATVSDGSRFERDSVDKLAADSTLTSAERAREPLLGKGALAEGPDRAKAFKGAAPGDEFAGAPAMTTKKGDAFAPNAAAGENAIAMGDVRAAQDRLQNADIARQLKDAPGGLKENAMFVVVSTADPAAAQSQVTSYLADNKITWDAIGHPMPEPIDVQPQDANLARQQRVDLRMKTGAQVQMPEQAKEKIEAKGGAGGAGAPAPAGNAQEQQAQAGVQQEDPASPPPARSAAQSGTADAGARIGGESPTIMSNVAVSDAALLDATKQQQTQRQLQEQVQQGQLALGQQRAPARRGLIIARSMTKQQATELSTTLSKQTTVQRAAVYEQQPALPAMADEARRSSEFGAATTRPATTTALAHSFGEAKQLPAAAAPAAAASPTTAPSGSPAPATQQVVGLDPLDTKAPPATQESLQPTTTTAPSPLPTAAGMLAQAAEQELGAAVATTQPAAADERVDVVILLQDDLVDAAMLQQQQQFEANPAPTTAPATQDSPAPATQPAPSPNQE